jgi:Mrp family chromosome partitioning ATPase
MAGEPLADCVTGTGIPGLFILPLGGAAAHHVPQLSPISMRRIFAEARAGYDTVLVDTGPVLGSLEAALSATESDKVILVLARGERRHMMRRAVEFLSEAGVGVAGAVFNRARYHDVVSSSSFSSSMSMRSVPRHRTPGRIATDGQPLGQTVVLGPIASAAQYVTQAGRQRGMNRD